MKRFIAAITAALLMVALVSSTAFAAPTVKQTGGSAPLLIPAVQVFPTVPISGGNDASVAGSAPLDTYASFVIVDTNKPITRNGTLTSWSFWAGATLPVTLDIVRLTGGVYTVVAKSATVTPTAAQVGGPVTTPLIPGLTVLAGDFVALYFASTGVVPYNTIGDPAVWTPPGLAANPAIGAALPIEAGLSYRTYSVSVTGTGPSDYDNACQVPTATGKVNWVQPRGNVDINLGISANGLTPLAQYTVYLKEGGFTVIGILTTDAYGHGSFGYSTPGGTLTPGPHTWNVYLNGPAASACAGYTVLVSEPIIFTM